MGEDVITVGGVEYKAPFRGVLRPLSQKERAALKTSIRKYGVLNPVLIDQEDNIIDGVNRAEIAAELGLPRLPVERWRISVGIEGKAERAIEMNHARRHLSPADWEALKSGRAERVERVAKARTDDKKSLRAIAAEEGVSEKQVRNDIRDAMTADPSAVINPEKITGRDGRTVKATRAPREDRETPAPQPRHEETLGLEGVHSEGLTRLLAAWRAADAMERFAFDEMRAAGRAG